MEASGVYWKPPWAILEDEFECLLCNARHVKQVPGRKTDVSDAAWLCQLLEAGLLRASFVPPKPIRTLRNLTRYRKAQSGERQREANRLQRSWRTPGSSSTASPRTSSAPRDGRCSTRSSPASPIRPCSPTSPRASCARSCRRSGRHWRAASTTSTGSSSARSSPTSTSSTSRSACSRRRSRSRSALSRRRLSCSARSPACKRRTAEVIVAEVGDDMSVFPSAGQLASWAGLCPGNDESAGKRRSGRTRKGSGWLGIALTEAAQANTRSRDTYLSAQYRRLKPRRGHKRAIGAVRHSIIVACWHMLSTGEIYRDAGGDYFTRLDPDKQARRLVAQLERLGHVVTLQEAA
ncbi:MAG: IS110 family transposase, partial [Gaiellaceae bacterium]